MARKSMAATRSVPKTVRQSGKIISKTQGTHKKSKTQEAREKSVTDLAPMPPPSVQEKGNDFASKTEYTPVSPFSGICEELQKAQRQRSIVMKSRIMAENRLTAIVAGTLGYASSLDSKERLKLFKLAREKIKEISEGGGLDHSYREIVLATKLGIDSFSSLQTKLEKEMLTLVKALPQKVLDWVSSPQQRGFGLPFLAILVGETGDLSNYSNPGKLFKRMAVAPYTFLGATWMGATWRSGKAGKLPADEWEKFGYSPRRRSISYLIGESLLKGNSAAEEKEHMVKATRELKKTPAREAGSYRRCYDAAKKKIKELHPDYPDQRCHRHGMLLATKRLLKMLWVIWNDRPLVDPRWGV